MHPYMIEQIASQRATEMRHDASQRRMAAAVRGRLQVAASPQPQQVPVLARIIRLAAAAGIATAAIIGLQSAAHPGPAPRITAMIVHPGGGCGTCRPKL
jgi:hypothetical protein